MSPGGSETIDLDGLALRGGEAETLELALRPDPPVVGGEPLGLDDPRLAARVDVSRTTSGYALRLRLRTVLHGRCGSCLGPARWEVEIDAREVEQASAGDPELLSPYVSDGVLDVGAWARDAITLALPDRLLCSPGCLGLCPECGIDLNAVDPPGSHRHERPLDPRFAKLRELSD